MSDNHAAPPPSEPGGTPDGGGSTAESGRRPGRVRGLLGGVAGYLQGMARDVVSVAAGRLLDRPLNDEPAAPTEPTAEPPADEASALRLRLLSRVADELRGATDSYIAAKLDEIEARVDAKLDHIERRIDDKIVELHRQLQELRDQELQHRLRLLKITLIFTVLVALLSLGYKWLSRFWQ